MEESDGMNKKVVVLILVGILMLSSLTFFSNKKKTFRLNGEEINEIYDCESKWHYEKFGFIPCVLNGSIITLQDNITMDNKTISMINYSISPEENCENLGANFTQYNLKNVTRAVEMYNSIVPNCTLIRIEDINLSWLKEKKCKKTFTGYDCGGGLIVIY